MKKLIGKRLAAAGLAVALVVSAVSVPNQASAAKAVKKVKVNKKKVTLYPKAEAGYGSIKIKATVTPKGAKAKLKWKSNKKKIATVNAKGLIKAKKAGKAVITVTAGKKKATVKVTVKKIKKKVTKVTVANNKLTVAKGKTAAINASVAPAKATLKALTYTSSNKAVATVSAKGVVTGVKAGTATITVKAVDGSKKKATVTVTVTDTTVAPTKAPTAAPTASATAAPSTEPTKAPTQAPTKAPTQAPTEAPTEAPTQAPTEAPTEAPTQAPTTAPTTAPTVAPTAGPVAPEKDAEIAGNVKYTLDAKSEYEVKTTVMGQNITLNTTDGTVNAAEKAFAKLLKGVTDYITDGGTCTEFAEKKIPEETYILANGVTVKVSKDEGAVHTESWGAWYEFGDITVTLNGISTDIDGKYTAHIYQDGNPWDAGGGAYSDSMALNTKPEQDNGRRGYYIEAFNDKNSFVVRFVESAPADGKITYEIDELKVKLGDEERTIAEAKDATDNITVTVTGNATGTEETVTVTRNNAKIVVKKTATGYTISVPESYEKKYGIVINKK